MALREPSLPLAIGDAVVSPARLASRRIQLRAVRPDDFQFIYALATSNEVGFRWRYRGQIPHFQTFVDNLVRDTLVDFVVMDRTDMTRLGYVAGYGADLRNGHCHVEVVMAPPTVGSALGMEGAILLLEYLFHTWPFRKLYFEIPEFNVPLLDGFIERHATLEGRLIEYAYLGGKYWDQLICSLHRDSWESSSPRFLRHIGAVG
jgi:RimJ/RimL family protein N-acetyltransferase